MKVHIIHWSSDLSWWLRSSLHNANDPILGIIPDSCCDTQRQLLATSANWHQYHTTHTHHIYHRQSVGGKSRSCFVPSSPRSPQKSLVYRSTDLRRTVKPRHYKIGPTANVLTHLVQCFGSFAFPVLHYRKMDKFGSFRGTTTEDSSIPWDFTRCGSRWGLVECVQIRGGRWGEAPGEWGRWRVVEHFVPCQWRCRRWRRRRSRKLKWKAGSKRNYN